ncbi:hypothetical protein KWH78_11990 [Morganella morganii]|uniref:hypothetical protein n=1 Tax=Morganella morganii TaxID=582 RepID=UPI0021D1B98D|nr:hypothetical protein [Morganella morganii]MCU6211831.1 hypothetical protein [Morganella morganii]
MANKKNTPEKPQEPGGLPPELMVNGQSKPESQQSDSGDKQDDQPTAEQNTAADSGVGNTRDEQGSDPEPGSDGVYVVTKGRSVQHDGEFYRENQQITLDDSDAARLIDLGVVMTLEAVRKMLAKANPPGTVTINGR